MTYRPTHLDTAPRRRRRAALAVAGVTSFAALFASAPAGAIGPSEASFGDLVVTADDSNSVGRCSFHIKDTDFSSNTATARLKSSARPTQILQAGQNASVAVNCQLFSTSTGNLLAVFGRTADGAYMPAKAVTVTVPIVADYTLCTQVITQLKSGDTTSAAVCDN